ADLGRRRIRPAFLRAGGSRILPLQSELVPAPVKRFHYRHWDRAALRPAVFVGEIVLVPEQILGQEDGGGDIALGRKGEQRPPDRHTALGAATLQRRGKRRLLLPALDCARVHLEKRGQLLLGALDRAEPFQFH